MNEKKKFKSFVNLYNLSLSCNIIEESGKQSSRKSINKRQNPFLWYKKKLQGKAARFAN